MSNTIENFRWADMRCAMCDCSMQNHDNMGRCLVCISDLVWDGSCTLRGVHFKAKMWVYQERKRDSMQTHLWRAGCTACFEMVSYWNPGAALGWALHHSRSCSRFRYALSLEPTHQSRVDWLQRISSSSGRQRSEGSIQVGPPWVEPSRCSCTPSTFCICYRHGCLGVCKSGR
jgi:hypothetical protein